MVLLNTKRPYKRLATMLFISACLLALCTMPAAWHVDASASSTPTPGGEQDKQEPESARHLQEDYLYINGASHIFKVHGSTGKIVWTSPEIADRSGPGIPPLLGENEVVVYASQTVFVLEKRTGTVRWQKKLFADGVYGYISQVLAVEDHTVYLQTAEEKVGTYEYTLVALNVQTGTQVWRTTPVLASIQTAQLVGNTILVGSTNGYVSAIQRETGKVLWKQNFAVPANYNLSGLNLLAVKSHVYVTTTAYTANGEPGDNILALQLENGHVLWRKDVAGSVHHLSYQPQIGLVFATAREFFGLNSLQCLEPKTGDVRWSTDYTLDAVKSIAFTRDTVYVNPFLKAIVYAFDGRSGVQRWQWEADTTEFHRGAVTDLVVKHDLLFTHVTTTTSSINALFALNARGEVAWSHSFGSEGFGMWIDPVAGNKQVCGGTIDAQNGQSKLYAFALKSGKVSWQTTLPEAMQNQSIVIGN